MRHNVEPCPDLETIAAYLDGQLPQDERERVAAHLAECETCYFVFTEAAQIRHGIVEEARPAPEPTMLSSTPSAPARRIVWSSVAIVGMAAVLLLAIGVGLISWPGDSPELRSLIVAVGADRPFEPRLSGGFAYGPVRAALRGSDAASAPPDVRIAVASLEKKAAMAPSGRNLHEVGIAYLVAGDIARAIVALESAVSKDASPNALNDLAAAYLVRGTRENRPEDVSRALTLATRAVQADPAAREALFNRAFAMDWLAMYSDARRAWEAYLRVDAESGWAAEARIHLQRLGNERHD